jgi:hypothetical protein
MVPKNKASDGAGNAATDKRRTHRVVFCCVMVRSNIHVAEIKNDKMAKKNRSLNTIVASSYACFSEMVGCVKNCRDEKKRANV